MQTCKQPFSSSCCTFNSNAGAVRRQMNKLTNYIYNSDTSLGPSLENQHSQTFSTWLDDENLCTKIMNIAQY